MPEQILLAFKQLEHDKARGELGSLLRPAAPLYSYPSLPR